MSSRALQRRERILVVDDEAGIRESFVALFGDEYDVREAADTAEALRAISADLPRLVFLDVRLGGESGLDLLSHLAHERADVPVVMVTAAPDEATERRSRELGAAAFVRKPFDIAEVERLARRLV